MMDKALKTSVYVNENVFCDSAEVAVDLEVMLPDYCPEISKIFKCKAEAGISSKGFEGQSISIEGTVYITLIYEGNDGCISSYNYQYPFSKSIETGVDCANANLQTKIRIEYVNCRAVTSRKVDIHGAAGLKVRVFKKNCKEIISDFEDENVEIRRGIAPATLPIAFAEKYLLIEEELRIGQGQPTVKNVLRFDAGSCIKETKIIKDKAVVKGEITLNILYCAETERNLQCIKTVLPFSQIIDLAGVSEECTLESKSEIAFVDVKPKTTVTGENKSFSVTAKVLISCEAVCSNDLAIILDAFSRKFQAEITRSNLTFEKIVDSVNQVYQCKKSVEFEEDITNVVDLWCNLQNCVTKFENGNMVVTATLMACMIVCNGSGNTIYCEKPIEFEYKYPVESKGGSLYAEPQIEIISGGYTITSANTVEIRAEVRITAAIYEKYEISLVSDMQLNTECINEKKNNCALVVYFCEEGDCVWEIARNYNASVNEIININKLEEEGLTAGKMILVPIT